MWKKGSVTIYGIMLGLAIIVLVLALAGPTQQFTESARNVTVGDTVGMDCNNDSISDFTKAACVATDVSLFYFISGLLLIAGVVITAKIYFS